MKIAVAVDGSEQSLRATEYALMLVEHFPKAHLEIIYVTDFNKVEDERLLKQSPNSLSLYQKKQIHPVMELVKNEGREAEITLLLGNPEQRIIKHVNANEIDHLVLSSRGLNALQKLVLGSVSQKVIKNVNCSVTVVK
ncbi:universal stress protein [Sporosarcina sp.]|uniref:universal stress protein n=1 Tax=Sporosarcina sp. TaxID=49982 RepID=UPI002637F658|nr:universal stress protein [Sporosarcina sp.]